MPSTIATRSPLPAPVAPTVRTVPFDGDDTRYDLRATATAGNLPLARISGYVDRAVVTSDFLSAVQAAARMSAHAGPTAIVQARDGVYRIVVGLMGTTREEDEESWTVESGLLRSVTTSDARILAVVDATGWFDLRQAERLR